MSAPKSTPKSTPEPPPPVPPKSTAKPPPESTTTPRPGPPSLIGEQCTVANVPFALPSVAAPTALISPDRVAGAGVLLLARIYGDQLRFFDAIDVARTSLDTDLLCLDAFGANPGRLSQQNLLNRLYCWPEVEYRVSLTTRQRLANKVLGIPAPGTPAAERDTQIQSLLTRMLDTINAVADPGPFRDKATVANLELLESVARFVEARFSTTVTGLVSMEIRDLQNQLTAATEILGELGPQLQLLPCRPDAIASSRTGTVVGPDVFGPLLVLVGKQLEADGVDLFQTAEIAEAWRVVFAELPNLATGTAPSAELSRAAAVLRPPGPDLLRVSLPDSARLPSG